MRRRKNQVTSGEDLFVGINLHKHRWHVTIRTLDLELLASVFQGPEKLCSVSWLALRNIACRRSMKRASRI
jgi:hypothetical protein